MSLFWEYKVAPKSEKHCGPQSHPREGIKGDVSMETSSGGLAIFVNIHPVNKENVKFDT